MAGRQVGIGAKLKFAESVDPVSLSTFLRETFVVFCVFVCMCVYVCVCSTYLGC